VIRPKNPTGSHRKWINDFKVPCDNYFISKILQMFELSKYCENTKVLKHTRTSKIYLSSTNSQEVIEGCILQTHENK
jgi:hypothetical protein